MKILRATIAVSMMVLASACSDGDISESMAPTGETPGNGQGGEAGLITAGEWNDLNNWSFWANIFQKQEYAKMPSYWSFYTDGRISVLVSDNNSMPVANAKLELKRNEQIIWTARTDNAGKAELWLDLFQENGSVSTEGYHLTINNVTSFTNLKLFKDGVNQLSVTNTLPSQNKAEIAFIVDATGSMGDEIHFLKKDLADVIKRVKESNHHTTILTSSVFYKDEGDQYLTRVSNFTENITTTLNFINQQSAEGGGDFPEAVHTALDKAVNELQWSDASRTKIAFLILDAPPHYRRDVINDLHKSIKEAAKKGIKIIPITASGIDKETEFLMRFFAISTNGTYVFITNHSGIGNDHLEPTVGEYEVEYLNNLMVRLINKYTE